MQSDRNKCERVSDEGGGHCSDSVERKLSPQLHQHLERGGTYFLTDKHRSLGGLISPQASKGFSKQRG